MTEIISIVLLLFLSIIFLIDVILTVRSNRKNKEELVSEVSRHTIDIADLKVTLDNLGEAYNNSVEAVQTELDGFYEAIEDTNTKIKEIEEFKKDLVEAHNNIYEIIMEDISELKKVSEENKSCILFDEKMLDRISEKQGKQIEEIEHRLSSIENSGTK
jgi:predicted transcriptional regulator